MPFLAFEILGRGVGAEPDHPLTAGPRFNRVQEQFGDAASTVRRLDPQILNVCRSKIRRPFHVVPDTRVNHSGNLAVSGEDQETNVRVRQCGEDGEFLFELSRTLVRMQFCEECGPERPVCLVRLADKQITTFLQDGRASCLISGLAQASS